MSNAIDYLDWRGDVPMDVSPFNEVDALIVCKLTGAFAALAAALLTQDRKAG